MTMNLMQGVFEPADRDFPMSLMTSCKNRSLVFSSHSSTASTITLTGPTRLWLAMAMNILQSSLKF